jgi:alpha-beta hydrolase superfamily lysophospholipase
MPLDSATAVEIATAQPRFIDGNGRALFAWHHSPPAHLNRGAGIVLCPALGDEYMSAYRTWRILAERLAALGFDTLRIDYDGTGNSAGDHDEPHRVDAWLRSINCAIDETRRLSGSRLVALVGLRAGALLALQAAAAAGGVERLVLWSPFPSGRAHLRELKAFARLSRQDHADEDLDEHVVNAAGHIVTRETVEALGRWTPDAITTLPAPDVLLVERDDRSVDSTLAAHLERLGSRVTKIRTRGTAEMLVQPQFAKVPEGALDEITTWLREWRGSLAPPAPHATSAKDCRAVLTLGEGYRERAVRFGPGERLFGILASPIDEHTAAPAIVLLNTSVEHHVGPHRLYVPLAREWAARGHPVLRFDIGGIGDSAPPKGGEDNAAYPRHMLDDAREAVAFFAKEAPHRRLIAAGLCSGGWLAFQAARERLPIDAVIAVNPPMYLREGAAAMQWVREGHELEHYQQSLRDPSKWVKALRGSASYSTFTRVAASAFGRHVALRVGRLLGDGLPSGLAKDLYAIAGFGIKSLFIFSRGDDGLTYFQQHARPAFRRRRVRDFVQHVVVEGAGHSFRPRSAQQTLRRLLSDFVASQVGGAPNS